MRTLLLLITLLGMLSSQRIPSDSRTFHSQVIDNLITTITGKLSDPILSKMFEACFPNTLDTTVFYFNNDPINPDSFIITGDINAMWMRDSANQVNPYLPYANQDPNLKLLLKGLINRQVKNILIDAYANAFNLNPTGSMWDSDITYKFDSNGKRIDAMIPELWERKYEIDSVAAFLKLSYNYYYHTDDVSFITEDYLKALSAVVTLLEEQQLSTQQESDQNKYAYFFLRNTNQPTDTTIHGRGSPSRNCGLIKSSFRPSDDACLLPFNIPGNAMLSVFLQKVSLMLGENSNALTKLDQNLLSTMILKMSAFADRINQAIYQNGITVNKKGQRVFAYEIDGFGNYLKMDDANLPSLLSLPYLEFIDVNNPLYQTTRNYLLSESENPYFFTGSAGEGIGGPHNGLDYVWPMSIITRIMTSIDDQEILSHLETLKTTTNGTDFMHESFNKNNANDYTRDWFAWANTYFGEMILYLVQNKPHLVVKQIQQ